MATFSIEIKASGDYTEEELRDYLAFQIGIQASISSENPFMGLVDNGRDAEIIDGCIYN